MSETRRPSQASDPTRQIKPTRKRGKRPISEPQPNGEDEAGTSQPIGQDQALPPGQHVRMNPETVSVPATGRPVGSPGQKALKTTSGRKKGAKPKSVAQEKTKRAKGNGAAGAGITPTELEALFERLVGIDGEAEFATALKDNAALIKGSVPAIREARAKRLRQAAEHIDLAAVHATIDRCLDMSPEEYAARLKPEARSVNLSAQKLDELIRLKRDRLLEDAKAKERELGLGDHPPPDAGELPAGVFTPEDTLRFFNEKYMVTCDGGRVFVCEPRDDPALHRRYFVHIRPTEFKVLHANRRVHIGNDNEGNPIYNDAVPFWLKHAERRQYTGGLVFHPGRDVAPDQFNLWQGFSVAPRPGEWSKLREHLLNVLCAGREDHFNYLFGWKARAVQRPDLKGEVAVVVIGEEGAGKSTVGEIFGYLFGQHAFAVSDPRHLTGNFNFHLRDCVFLHAEEVFHAGDKTAASILRNLITSPTLVIEGKGQNAIIVPNRLHLMMTANPGWVIPAGPGARRFFVLYAGNKHISDYAYFGAIRDEMENGGYEALLYDLLNYDLSNFNIRAVPGTDALIEQKKLSHEPHRSWWEDVLHRGFVFDSKLGLGEHFTEWIDPISMELLYKSYLEHARTRHERHPLSREALGKFLISVGGEGTRGRNLVIGEQITDRDKDGSLVQRHAELLRCSDRAYAYEFGGLAEARRKFVNKTGLLVDWGSDEEKL
jgi:hypothetical protein